MQTQLYKAEDLHGLADDFELDEGRLVPLMGNTFNHGRLVARISFKLNLFISAGDLGDLAAGDPFFVIERSPDTVRGPDIGFVRAERRSEIPERGWFEGSPDLAIEVTSLNDRPADVLRKIGQYLGAGCRLVWQIDESKRQIIAYAADGSVRIFAAGDTLDGGDVLPGFTWAIDDVFGSAPVKAQTGETGAKQPSQ